MKQTFCVKKRSLLLIAGIVWMIAGFNVARLGVISYLRIEQNWYLYLMSLFVFLLFGFMFFQMSKKHTNFWVTRLTGHFGTSLTSKHMSS